MRRPQFSLKTLLWLMAVVAAFCAGAVWQRERDRQEESERLIELITETVQPAIDHDIQEGGIRMTVPASQAPR
jgi:hypothetical protein